MQAWVNRGDRREDIDSVASRWRMASVRPLCLGTYRPVRRRESGPRAPSWRNRGLLACWAQLLAGWSMTHLLFGRGRGLLRDSHASVDRPLELSSAISV